MLGRCLLERSRCDPPIECLLLSCTLDSPIGSGRSLPVTTCKSWLGHDPDLM
jgi:hypothetical protein